MSASINSCIANIAECAKCAAKMRAIVENEAMGPELRYKAIVIEEAHLELIQRYIQKIDELKKMKVADFKI
jgi:hypothetical protein